MAEADRFSGGWFSSTFELTNLSSLTLSGQSTSHVVCLALGLLFLCASLAAAVTALIDRDRGRLRFLWAVGSLVGFGKCVVIWSGGEPFIYPTSIQIPVLIFSVPRDIGQIFVFGVPVIALAYMKRRFFRNKAKFSGHAEP